MDRRAGPQPGRGVIHPQDVKSKDRETDHADRSEDGYGAHGVGDVFAPGLDDRLDCGDGGGAADCAPSRDQQR